jgi:Na+(H+)/acetate symporter ActP
VAAAAGGRGLPAVLRRAHRHVGDARERQRWAEFAVALLVLLAAAVAGAVVWFVKTNGALNRYWASLGAA